MARRPVALMLAATAVATSLLAPWAQPAGALGQRSAGCTALNGQTLTAPVVNVNPHQFTLNERVDIQVTGTAGDGASLAVNGAVVAGSATLPASLQYYIPADGSYSFHLADTLGQPTTWHSTCVTGPYPTISALTGYANAPVAGQTVSFTSVVGGTVPDYAPTGSVSYFINGSPTPTATAPLVDGHASVDHVFATTGTYTINAVYSGDAFNSASSDQAFIEVAEASTATTLLATPAVQSPGKPVVLSGTVGSVAPGSGTPTGTVVILNRGTPIATATVTGGSYSTSVSTTTSGTYTLHAVYTGDANYSPSLSPNSTVRI